MVRTVTLLAVLSLVLVSAVRAEEEPPSVESLIRYLGHDDGGVRLEAAGELLARGFETIAPLRQAAGGEHPVLAREAEALRRILVIARRLSEPARDTATFWMLLEELYDLVPERHRVTALLLALGKPADVQAVDDRRERAISAVRTFCRDWNEMSVPGSALEKRYAALRKELEDAGAAAAPHLMRVLDVHHSRAFLHVEGATGVTARMQVRAIYGLSFLGSREAVPYFLVHSNSTSITAGTNAAAAFWKLVSEGETVPAPRPDANAMVDWWSAHRTGYPHGARWAVRAQLAELHRDAACEVVGIPFPVWKTVEMMPGALVIRRRAVIQMLEALLGRGVEIDAAAPAKERLAQVRAVEERFEAEVFR
jgi:hypothetical protein